MTMQLAQPIRAAGRSFEPRIVGQTTLFPLEDDLQSQMEKLYRRAVQKNETIGARNTITGFIHDWVKDKNDRKFRDNAEQVLATFTTTLRPYIDGLELHELGGNPHLGPALMRYEAHHGNVTYSLTFRISDHSTYLIASPELECTLPDSSAIKPALDGMDPNHVYERILDYVFRGKELDRDYAEYVEVKPWGYEFALKPVLVGDIPKAAAELSEAAKKLEDKSEAIHQAASLISFASEGVERSRKLEEKLMNNPAIAQPRRLAEERMYTEARKLLDEVKIEKTPTLNKYFV